MKHVIKRIDELVAQTDQTKALWHILMCIRLAAVDDWNIQQEIVDEVYEKMRETGGDADVTPYYEGFCDGIDFVLGLIQEKTGLTPMKEL
jgi:hypothetical protein